MAEMKYVKEFLTTGTGTEGSLLIEKEIYGTLIGEVEKALIPRELAALVFGPEAIPGSSIDVDLEDPNTFDVRQIGEGAAIYVDNVGYSSFNMKPVKYGVSVRITREMVEDGKWNLIQRHIMLAGKRMAENENSLVVSDALDNAGNTVAGGAAITIANITRAMQYLEDLDYAPTDFVVGMEVLNDLRNIDTFVEANKSGDVEMIKRGFRGVVFGMLVHAVSTNAGMTATSSYVLDRTQAYAIAEKRRFTVENFDLPTHDMSAAAITCRVKVRHIRANAIAKITTT